MKKDDSRVTPEAQDAKFSWFLTDFGQHRQGKNNTKCNDDEEQPAI